MSTDVMLELGGANVFASVLANREDRDNGGTVDQWGAIVQGGIFLSDDYEVFVHLRSWRLK